MADHSDDYKRAAVRHYLNISHIRAETCRIFGCLNLTLGRWIERFQAEGNLDRHNRQSRVYKMSETQVQEAVDFLANHQTKSISELHAHLQETFDDFDISVAHLYRVVRDNNLTRKRTKHGHYPRVRRGVENNRKADLEDFYRIVSAHPIDRIVSIDETSLTPFMFRPYSRCALGEKCIEITDENKVFTKHTFVGAITSSRCVGWQAYERGAMNADRFVEFVRSIINRHRLSGYLFLVDNAGAHKGQGIRDLVQQTGNTLQYTIPYNPQTNAIENWFSQFKHYMRNSTTRNFDGVRDDCRRCIRKITPEHYHNYFQYAYRKHEYQHRERPRASTRRRPPKNYKVDA